MSMSENERAFMEGVVSELSAEERARLPDIPFACLLRCAIRFLRCGPTTPQCQDEFIDCVLRCFGVERAAGGGRST